MTVDDEGRVALPEWVRGTCDLRPGDQLLIGQNYGSAGGLFLGMGLILISPSAIGRRFRRLEETLRRIDPGGASAAPFDDQEI